MTEKVSKLTITPCSNNFLTMLHIINDSVRIMYTNNSITVPNSQKIIRSKLQYAHSYVCHHQQTKFNIKKNQNNAITISFITNVYDFVKKSYQRNICKIRKKRPPEIKIRFLPK